MASLDIYRPAAMEQLAILGSQIGVDTLPVVAGETAVQIAKRAKQQATLGGYALPGIPLKSSECMFIQNTTTC